MRSLTLHYLHYTISGYIPDTLALPILCTEMAMSSVVYPRRVQAHWGHIERARDTLHIDDDITDTLIGAVFAIACELDRIHYI